MEIRLAREGDIPAVAALEGSCFSLGAPEDMLLRMLRSGDLVLLCAAEGETLAGYGYFFPAGDRGDIGNLAVAPEYRRRGLGRALTEAMQAEALRRGLSALTLEVRESNLPARRLYEAAGFQTVGVRKNYYERPREDAVLMTADLSRETGSKC